MIKVLVSYDKKLIKQVTIKGHAGYDLAGKDIVCAAVSSMATTTVNNILTLDSEAINYDCLEGKLVITVNNSNEIAIKLLECMLNMLEELAKTYPKNIKIGG